MIRSYSLIVALSLLAINEFFHWYLRRDWLSGVRCAGVILLLLLAHLNGLYTVAFLATICSRSKPFPPVGLAAESLSGNPGLFGFRLAGAADSGRRGLLAPAARYRQG